MAWRGERDESLDQYIDARVGAVRFAEFVNSVMAALSSKGSAPARKPPLRRKR